MYLPLKKDKRGEGGDDDESSLSDGEIAAIVICSVLAVMLIGVGVWWFFCRRQAQK
jgi:hypothetical protein